MIVMEGMSFNIFIGETVILLDRISVSTHLMVSLNELNQLQFDAN